MFWSVLLANIITLLFLLGLILNLVLNKDKIRKWIYHKKSIKKGVKNK